MATSRSLFKKYYQLAKPGIIYGNALVAIGAFFLAEKGHFNATLFLAMLFGLCLIIASGCVFNNYFDRGIDAKMKRTKKRSLVTGEVPLTSALIYATALGAIGIILLATYTNILTLAAALVGLFFYVIVYGYTKRTTVYGTLVGSVAGAVPPVVGYCAVTNRFDAAALILFLILVIWQMPHFYAIAMFRHEDYAAARLPVLPVVHGNAITKVHLLAYIIAFALAAAALTFFGYTHFVYLAVMLLLSLYWLRQAIQGFSTNNDTLWARSVFRSSLIILTAFCVLIGINAWLP